MSGNNNQNHFLVESATTVMRNAHYILATVFSCRMFALAFSSDYAHLDPAFKLTLSAMGSAFVWLSAYSYTRASRDQTPMTGQITEHTL